MSINLSFEKFLIVLKSPNGYEICFILINSATFSFVALWKKKAASLKYSRQVELKKQKEISLHKEPIRHFQG